MTNKFDGNLWKWLLANVMGKLAPSTEEATEGQVLTVGDEGAMEWTDPSTGRDVPATSGASAGDVLTVDSESGYGWAALPEVSEVPSAAEASDGDVLTADGSGGFAWEAPSGGGSSYETRAWRKTCPSTVPSNYKVDLSSFASAMVTAINKTGGVNGKGNVIVGARFRIQGTDSTTVYIAIPQLVECDVTSGRADFTCELFGRASDDTTGTNIVHLGKFNCAFGYHEFNLDTNLFTSGATISSSYLDVIVLSNSSEIESVSA